MAVRIYELTAGEAMNLWPLFTEAEQTGKVFDAYLALVTATVYKEDGEHLFSCVEDASAWPARLIVPLAETAMELTGLGLEAGKDQPDPAET